ncbi:phosphoribosylanthranilate isomerase [Rhizobium hainanense]|uniref:Phosphoribosylanthranilate isomerase n=1 Tax=Rhizobium hainanense TaxID=52131 RepID=A0A1C3WGW6_9HYPH|nr:phosphoribosylanthranilate isomerase [Rhizobium hainanense]SCB39175.1 phosphoribosylanthranilate isomerase [Rhizobium hainanense]
MQLPAFVAFTGVDRSDYVDGLRALSARYPIEWGVLVDDAQISKPLFPEISVRRAFLAAGGLRLAAHVCGDEARRIANEPDTATVNLAGYQRVQVNHSFSGSSSEQIENTWRYGRRHGVRTMLQCKDEFPIESRLDWLFDVSFGTGITPRAWPRLPRSGPFCGYSGGINPGNVKDVLNAISAERGDMYWIDMESGIRTDGWLDLDKCESVCRAVYG